MGARETTVQRTQPHAPPGVAAANRVSRTKAGLTNESTGEKQNKTAGIPAVEVGLVGVRGAHSGQDRAGGRGAGEHDARAAGEVKSHDNQDKSN